jgi:protein-S-isoprenylcysteine O-methyltransferase Ste14
MSHPSLAGRLRVPLGFALGILYVWLAKPTWTSLAAGGTTSLVGLWLRARAAGHVRKNAELTTSGPYSHTRNPLYLGSIVTAAGFAAAAKSGWLVLALALMFILIYVPVIRSEERFLRATFPGYDDYAVRVPRLFPRFTSAFPEQQVAWSRARYIKVREYNALVGSVFLWCVLVVKIVIGQSR